MNRPALAAAPQSLHRAQIARAFAELGALGLSEGMVAERERLWEEEASRRGEVPALTDAASTPLWLEIECLEDAFIGYVAQLARSGKIVQDPGEVSSELERAGIFTAPPVVAFCQADAARYPLILRYLTLLDYLRLLAREHLGEYG